MAENINITLQKLANNSAKSIQDSVNKANMEGLKFNAAEAEKARKFNAQEAATARKYNAQEALLARQFNAAEALKSRQWQEKMSKSSHQIEVADLKKAGLNPVLSAGAGAQSYTTSSASAGAASSSAASGPNANGSVDSGANAYGSIMSALMSNMTGLKQSEMSSAAQRYSADKSYHAAELSAQAMKYQAQMSAQAQKYVADRNYQAQMDKPQGNPIAVLDKYFGNKASSVIGNTVGSLKAGRDYSYDPKTGSYGYNPKDSKIQKNLRILGIEPNNLSRNELNKASYELLVAHNEKGTKRADKAAKYLKELSNKNKNRASTISKTSPFAGNNWNPYNNGYN